MRARRKAMLREPIRTIVKKMFEIAGHEFSDKIEFCDKRDPWYLKHTWTQEQCDEFFKWLKDELTNNAELRMMTGIPKSDLHIGRYATMWHLYCFKVRRNDGKPKTDIRHSEEKED